MATYDLTSVSIPTTLAIGDILNCPYSGDKVSITLPAGRYLLECWGAQGGYRNDQKAGGKGGYSKGVLTLEEATNLFLYAGGEGNNGVLNGTIMPGGYNGGGYRHLFPGGGGASDIRIGTDSLYARVIVAGGGGSDGSAIYAGGAAGTSAENGNGTGGIMGNTTYSGTSTSTTASYQAKTELESNDLTKTYGGFGFGGSGLYYLDGYGGAGGGGWYGGQGVLPDSSMDDEKGGGGGSGYVYTKETATQVPTGYLLTGKYYLSLGETKQGIDSFISPNNTTETGHIGNGYIRISVGENIDNFSKRKQARIQQKGHSSTDWDPNLVLLSREIGIETDTNMMKIGDGITPWSLLPYCNNSNSEIDFEKFEQYGDINIVPSNSNYFILNETGQTITGLTNEGKQQTELIIPYKINGKLITGLCNDEENISILNGNNVITKVIIPNSVTNIGWHAFEGCSLLKSINIPNGVTDIGFSAFKGCSSLKSINIPDGIRYIDTNGFRDCTSLKEINIPNSVTNIDIYAFAGCTSLTSINIPNSVTNIGDFAFNDCTNLTIYCEQGSYAETYAKQNNIPVVYTDIKADNLINNILDDAAIGSLHQKFDGDNYFDFTGKNPNATSLDSTLTGNITKGATGNYASSFGGKSAAMGKRSLAEGTTTIAKGNYSHAEGDNSVALGNDSHAEGYMTVSKGDQSHAEGIRTISKGTSSHTEGYETESTGAYSHAEGEITKSTGEASHTEGFKTESAGLYSHAEGNNSKVLTSLPSTSSTGGSSSTESTGVTSDNNWNVDEHFGEAAHVEGADNIAIGFASHAEGVNNKAHGHYAHAEGIKNIAGLETAEGVILAPHAEGYNTKAFGHYSHSEGYATEASGSNSHAEGDQTVASGTSSHAEGHNTKASNDYSHSEGSDTIATGTSSHAEGGGTKASGDYSHAEGEGTIASKRNQHVQGKFNIEDTTNNYAHIIGNGSNIDLRSNAHTVDWNGNAWYAGDIKIGGNSYSDQNAKILATKDYVDNKYSNIELSEYYTKSETYSKTEIDSKVSSVYRYKGTVPSAMLLPDTNDAGDVYNTTFGGYVPYSQLKNYTLTGISFEGSLTIDTEITLTFNNSVSDMIEDIAFWFDSQYFFIGKVVNISTNSYVVKIADLNTTDTIYSMNPCYEAIMDYRERFSSSLITSLVININYFTNFGSGFSNEFIPKGGNVAWTGSGWDSLGSTIDTSNFATKKYVDDAINASSSGEATTVSTVKTCTGDELISITSPALGSIRYVSTSGTGNNISITPGLYFYLDSWKKVAIEDTAIISNEFVSGGDSTSINN